MTLPASAPISMAQVMTELRIVTPARAYPIALGDADVRALAGVPSGPISLTNLLGKSAYLAMSGSVPDVFDDAPSGPVSSYTATVPVSISLTGGLAPFSYAWSKLSGSGTLIAVNAASTSAEFLVVPATVPDQEFNQVVQCIVTDAMGNTLTRSGTVTLILT